MGGNLRYLRANVEMCEDCHAVAGAQFVLVIDAQPLQSNQLRMLLEQIGAQVEYAHGGLDGLALVEALVPDIVLLDLTLPDGEAYTVCRTIRKLAQVQTVPVLALLEREVKQVIERAYDAGVTDCLSKSVCGTILRRRVRTGLRTTGCPFGACGLVCYLPAYDGWGRYPGTGQENVSGNHTYPAGGASRP